MRNARFTYLDVPICVILGFACCVVLDNCNHSCAMTDRARTVFLNNLNLLTDYRNSDDLQASAPEASGQLVHLQVGESRCVY